MRVHFYKNWSTFTITSEVYLRSAEKMRVSGIQLIEGKKNPSSTAKHSISSLCMIHLFYDWLIDALILSFTNNQLYRPRFVTCVGLRICWYRSLPPRRCRRKRVCDERGCDCRFLQPHRRWSRRVSSKIDPLPTKNGEINERGTRAYGCTPHTRSADTQTCDKEKFSTANQNQLTLIQQDSVV